MENNHTPGPWHYHKNPFSTRTVLTKDKLLICEINPHRGNEHADANAKLISAAPDILNALKILLEEAERVAMLVDSKYWTEDFREKWNKNTLIAEQAIQKATK